MAKFGTRLQFSLYMQTVKLRFTVGLDLLRFSECVQLVDPWLHYKYVYFNLFVPYCLTGTNTALCHEYIAGTERDLYLKLTRSSLFPNNKQYSIHFTCSLLLLT